MSVTPDELASRMHRAAEEIREPSDLMQRLVLIGEGAAKRQIVSGPNRAVKSGTWLRSISQRVIRPVMGAVTSSARHGPFVHEGTRKMKARPAIEDGIQESKPKMEREAANYADGVLGKVGG